MLHPDLKEKWMLEMAMRAGLVILNAKSTPTLKRAGYLTNFRVGITRVIGGGVMEYRRLLGKRSSIYLVRGGLRYCLVYTNLTLVLQGFHFSEGNQPSMY